MSSSKIVFPYCVTVPRSPYLSKGIRPPVAVVWRCFGEPSLHAPLVRRAVRCPVMRRNAAAHSRLLASTSLRSCARLLRNLRGYPPKRSFFGAFRVPRNSIPAAAPSGGWRRSRRMGEAEAVRPVLRETRNAAWHSVRMSRRHACVARANPR